MTKEQLDLILKETRLGVEARVIANEVLVLGFSQSLISSVSGFSKQYVSQVVNRVLKQAGLVRVCVKVSPKLAKRIYKLASAKEEKEFPPCREKPP